MATANNNVAAVLGQLLTWTNTADGWWVDFKAEITEYGCYPTLRNLPCHESRVGFGIVDDKGRELGMLVRLTMRPDGTIGFYGRALRGGKTFGATHAEVTIETRTLDDAKAFATAKIVAAQGRAMRTFGKAAA